VVRNLLDPSGIRVVDIIEGTPVEIRDARRSSQAVIGHRLGLAARTVAIGDGRKRREEGVGPKGSCTVCQT
jgi:hypothetical protein